MFVSFPDWGFDGNVDNAVESAKGFWPEMKKRGEVNMRATVAGEKTLRTMNRVEQRRTAQSKHRCG